MSRTKKFLGGVGFGYANQALVTVVGLWLTPFVLGRVGQHEYGLWLVSVQVLAYLALLDFGVVALLPRETAFATGRAGAGGGRSAEELPKLVGQTARLVLWQMPPVVLAALSLWLFLPARWEAVGGPLGFVLATFVLMFPLRIFPAVLQGLQDLKFLAQAQACAWLAGTALTVALVFAGAGLYSLAAGWAATQLLATPVMIYRLRRRFPEAWPKGLARLPSVAARARLSSGFWVSLNQVAVVLLYGTDLLVIGQLLGPAAVVPYACTAKLITVFANQPQMLMQLAMPALSELRAGGRREHLARVCIALSQAMLWMSGAVACIVLATNEGFVGWWVGAAQYGGFWLTLLVLLNMLLRHLNLTVGYVLFSCGMERRLALTALLDGLVTLCAVFVLAGRFGLTGAAAGAVVGVCLVSLPANLRGLASANAMPAGELLRSLAPWCWRFALLALAAGAWGRSFAPESFQALAATAILAGGAYLLVMLPVALREPLGPYVRPRLSTIASRFSRVIQRPRTDP
jgi:O-antigen/teichoic acid export membrane protein